MWILGDAFLLDVFAHLSKIRLEAIRAKSPTPFIYDQYNIKFFTANPLSEVRSMLTKLVNSLIKALNEATKLPRFVLVIPDLDVMKFIGKVEEGVEAISIFENALNWIILEMDKAVRAKKDELRKRRKGSVVSTEPKLIWVKTLNRPGVCSDLLKNRPNFNDAMEKCLLNKSGHYIIDITSQMMEKVTFSQMVHSQMMEKQDSGKKLITSWRNLTSRKSH